MAEPLRSSLPAELEASEAPPSGEVELVALAKHDPVAFALLYHRYVDLIFKYCFLRLSSKEDAEDTTSDIFTNAFEALPRLREDAAFRGWLFTIAHNAVVARYRARRVTETLESASQRQVECPTLDDLIIAASVRDLLAQLPESQRRAMDLHLSGLSDAEVGERLGRSRAAISMLLTRARACLRRLVEPERDASMEDYDGIE